MAIQASYNRGKEAGYRDGSVAIIIVNYNGGEKILECLRSLHYQTYSNHHILVVDNQSTDGSLDSVKRQFPHVKTIENAYNAGWCVACNQGVVKTESEFVLLLNNDTYLDKYCLEKMVEAIQLNGCYGACSNKILIWDKPDCIEVAGLAIVRDGLSVGRGRLKPANSYSEMEEVFCPSGCCGLFRRKMLDKTGLYDPAFFMYAEDTDLGWRFQKAGWKCIYTPHAIAYHAHSQTAGCFSDFKGYQVERNRIYICLKHFPLRQLVGSFIYAAFRYLYQVRISANGKGALARYREQTPLIRGLQILIRAHLDAIKTAPSMLKRKRGETYDSRYSLSDFNRIADRFGISIRDAASYE